nr:hypothetical protein [Burkholderia ubonensis]
MAIGVLQVLLHAFAHVAICIRLRLHRIRFRFRSREVGIDAIVFTRNLRFQPFQLQFLVAVFVAAVLIFDGTLTVDRSLPFAIGLRLRRGMRLAALALGRSCLLSLPAVAACGGRLRPAAVARRARVQRSIRAPAYVRCRCRD